MAEPNIRKTIDKTAELLRRVAELTGNDVLVGVPADKTGRKQGPVNNATLAYIHEFGSPARNIPARPFLYPGIRKAKPEIVATMKQGAIDVLHGKAAMSVLSRVGMLARNSVVREITDPAPPFVPLKPATIRARLRRTAAGRRKLKQIKARGQTLTGWAQAIDPGTGSANIHPLIDTGQLRASLTYVVRKIR
jgi:hypothetical protein